MTLGTLVRRNILRHPVRSGLTMLAAMVAFFLLVFLRSIVTTLDDAVNAVARNRVIVQSAVSLYVELPENYRSKIAAVEGVESVGPMTWFGGVYRDPSNFFGQFAIDPTTFLDQYTECVLDDEEERAFLADRRACLVGMGLMRRFPEFEIGAKVPLEGTIFRRTDGRAWEFTIAGIYESTSANLDESTMWFHHDFLRESLEEGGAEGPDGVSVYVVKVADGYDAARVAEAIDAVFSGGPQRTRTQSEAAFQAGFVSMMGNIPRFVGWIGAAVLFALLLTIANTTLIASAERVKEVGVMKALGFSKASCGGLFVIESSVITIMGGIAGVVLADVSVPVFRQVFGTMLPNFAVRDETMVLALSFAVVSGVVGGLGPAVATSRVSPAEAFRSEI